MKQLLKDILIRLHLESLIRLYQHLRALVPPVIRVNVALLFHLSLSWLRKPRLPEKQFVIFSRGRSRSTLLVNLLKSYDHMYCDGDILMHPVLFPARHVEICASRCKGETYGCKILTYQLQEVQPFLRPRDFLLRLHEEGYKIIYLTHANPLRYALSNIYARQVQFHSRVSDGPPERKAIRVAVEDVFSWLEENELRASFEREALRDIPYLSLIYEEDLLDSRLHQRTVDKICGFVGIPSATVSTDLQKTTARALSDLVINLDELSDALANTPYAQFLSDV